MTMTHVAWLNVLIVIGLFGAAEEVLRRLVGKPIGRVWNKVERFLDTWNGIPASDGYPARAGLVDRVVAIEATQREQLGLVQSMHHELHPNGGASMRDAVDRIDSTATRTQVSLDEHIAQSEAQLKLGHAAEEDIRNTISNLAEAVKVAARSTPPQDEDEEEHDGSDLA